MNTCSNKVFAAVYSEDEKAQGCIDTNIISLTFNDVHQKQQNLDNTPPTYCSMCQAILSNYSTVYEIDEYKSYVSQFSQLDVNEEHKSNPAKENALDIISFDKLLNNEKVWICDFCGKHNVLSNNFINIPKTNDVFYAPKIVNENEEEKMDIPFKSSSQDQTVIFCIDNSGSMSGINLNCVKKAVLTQIDDIHSKYPNKKIALVTFESGVIIYGDGCEKSCSVPHETYNSIDNCVQFGVNSSEKLLKNSISLSVTELKKLVGKLETGGSTALGPGLLASIGLVLKGKPGSMIVLCTDGMANVGLGSMDSKEVDSFYNSVGKLAKENSILISVLTIKGSECKVDKLAVLADLTGGMVSRIKPSKIGKDFNKAMIGEMIGTDANLRLQLHRALCFRNEDSIYISKEEASFKKNSIFSKELGNVTLSTEDTFEYGFKNKKELVKMGLKVENLKELPIQAQIKYTNLEGVDVLRVFTLKVEVTNNLDEVKKNANVKIVAMRAAHDVAKEGDKGNLVFAKKKFDQWDVYLEKELNEANKDDDNFQKYYKIVKTKNEKLAKELTKNIARKMKKQDKNIIQQVENLSDSGKDNLKLCVAANSSSGSSDENEATMKKFKKKRQASYECLSELDNNSDDAKLKNIQLSNSDSESENDIKIKTKIKKRIGSEIIDSGDDNYKGNTPKPSKNLKIQNSSSYDSDSDGDSQKKSTLKIKNKRKTSDDSDGGKPSIMKKTISSSDSDSMTNNKKKKITKTSHDNAGKNPSKKKKSLLGSDSGDSDSDSMTDNKKKKITKTSQDNAGKNPSKKKKLLSSSDSDSDNDKKKKLQMPVDSDSDNESESKKKKQKIPIIRKISDM